MVEIPWQQALHFLSEMSNKTWLSWEGNALQYQDMVFKVA